MSNNRVSRRQFLNYTLTGVGGFMAAGMLMPMICFALTQLYKLKLKGILYKQAKKLMKSQKNQLKLTLHLNKLMLGTNLMLQKLLGFIEMVMLLSPFHQYVSI